MPYLEVGQFSYGATRNYYNGAYTGTTVNMRFLPVNPGGKSITYTATVRNADDELDGLRDHVSRVVGSHMLDRLHQDGEVLWTANATLTREGVRFRKAKFIGTGDEVLLPYSQISGINFATGVFQLFETGNVDPVLKITVSEMNFFPGFMALSMIMAPEEEAAAAPEEPPPDEVSGLPAGFA
jgi:hypothetical protein